MLNALSRVFGYEYLCWTIDDVVIAPDDISYFNTCFHFPKILLHLVLENDNVRITNARWVSIELQMLL